MARATPEWVITEDFDDVDLGVIATGKEGEVGLVERVAHDGARSHLIARKRYRPRKVTRKGELQELGFERVPTRIVEPEDEAEHMLRSALRRRHLSASQRAALALELADYHLVREQADKRRRANLRQTPDVATLPPRGERSREYAARVSGAGPRTVQDAATVREADPALFKEIVAGTLPAHRAAQRVRRERRYAEIGSAPAASQRPLRPDLTRPGGSETPRPSTRRRTTTRRFRWMRSRSWRYQRPRLPVSSCGP